MSDHMKQRNISLELEETKDKPISDRPSCSHSGCHSQRTPHGGNKHSTSCPEANLAAIPNSLSGHSSPRLLSETCDVGQSLNRSTKRDSTHAGPQRSYYPSASTSYYRHSQLTDNLDANIATDDASGLSTLENQSPETTESEISPFPSWHTNKEKVDIADPAFTHSFNHVALKTRYDALILQLHGPIDLDLDGTCPPLPPPRSLSEVTTGLVYGKERVRYPTWMESSKVLNAPPTPLLRSSRTEAVQAPGIAAGQPVGRVAQSAQTSAEAGQVVKFESYTSTKVKKQLNAEIDENRPMTRARAKKLALENGAVPRQEPSLSTLPAGPTTKGVSKDTEPQRAVKGRVTRSRGALGKRGREEADSGERESKRAKK